MTGRTSSLKPGMREIAGKAARSVPDGLRRVLGYRMPGRPSRPFWALFGPVSAAGKAATLAETAGKGPRSVPNGFPGRKGGILPGSRTRPFRGLLAAFPGRRRMTEGEDDDRNDA